MSRSARACSTSPKNRVESSLSRWGRTRCGRGAPWLRSHGGRRVQRGAVECVDVEGHAVHLGTIQTTSARACKMSIWMFWVLGILGAGWRLGSRGKGGTVTCPNTAMTIGSARPPSGSPTSTSRLPRSRCRAEPRADRSCPHSTMRRFPRWRPSDSRSVLSPGEYEALLGLVDQAARELHGRVIWDVTSTGKGGGVVEMLRPLLGYCRGAGVDARWAVISGQPRILPGDRRAKTPPSARVLGGRWSVGRGGAGVSTSRRWPQAPNSLPQLVHPRDIGVLHHPQTAGLARAVRRTGATVMWRCHVGLDVANDNARGAWDFLRGYVLRCPSVRISCCVVVTGAPAAWTAI